MKPNKQDLVDLDDIKPNTGSSIMTLWKKFYRKLDAPVVMVAE